VLDNDVPYSDADQWRRWHRGSRDSLPEPLRPPGERRRGPDCEEYALQARLLAFDPLLQREVWEMRACRWSGGELVAEETHRLTANLYVVGEVVMMLERAGFSGIEVRSEYNDPGTDCGRRLPGVPRHARVMSGPGGSNHP
jgi:hypothetical protein